MPPMQLTEKGTHAALSVSLHQKPPRWIRYTNNQKTEWPDAHILEADIHQSVDIMDANAKPAKNNQTAAAIAKNQVRRNWLSSVPTRIKHLTNSIVVV
jgi:hypothetical protein